jgi:hypothetical protein
MVPPISKYKILKARGFGEKWIKWMEMLLGSGTSLVLLNGVSGKKITAKEELG